MAEEQLRLKAGFDGAGAQVGIRKLREQLEGIHRLPGMESVLKWADQFKEKADSFVKDGGGVGAALSGMGIGGLAAAGSLAEVVRQFTEMGRKAVEIRELGRQVGLTVDQLNNYGKAAEQFNVSSEKIQGAIAAFRGQMPDFMAGKGPLHDSLAVFPKFRQQLKADYGNAAKQFEDIMKMADQPRLRDNPQLQKQFFESVIPGHGEDLEKLEGKGSGAFMKAFEEMSKATPDSMSAFMKQAEAFDKATKGFNEALENLKMSAAPSILTQMAKTAEDLTKLIDAINNPDETLKKMQENRDKGAGRFGPGLVPGGQATIDEMNAGMAWLKEHDPHTDQWLGESWKRLKQWFSGSSAAPSSPFGVIDSSAFADGAPSGRVLRTIPRFADDAVPIHKEAFRTWSDAPNPMLTSASLRSGFFDRMGLGALNSSDPIMTGTKEGVLAAFREWAQQSASGSTSGFQQAKVEILEGVDEPSRAGGGGRFHGVVPLMGGGNGSRSWRNNNPGNMAYGAFAREHGAIGTDGRFAIFPDYQTGRSADEALLFNSKAYAGLNVAQAIAKYAPPSENDTAGYIGQLGIASNTPLSSLNAKQRLAMLDSIQRIEGWRPGSHQNPLVAARSAPGGASYPSHIGGQLSLNGQSYRFGSGGAGNASIPFGDYPITPGAIGAWGSAHGALGINNGQIWDKTLGRMRAGIELHASQSAALITEGCVAFQKEQWPQVKGQILGMIKRSGHAYLHVRKDGASITPESRARPDLRDTPQLGDRGERDRQADAPQGKLDIHLHDPKGHIRKTGLIMAGMSGKVHRRPTVTTPSEYS